MTGQKKKSKSQIVNEYLKKVNPYEKTQAINFNLREYAAYIKANGLNGDRHYTRDDEQIL